MPASLRAAVLVPAANFHEEWRWAYDIEAAALTAAGIAVEPRPWTDPGVLAGFDAILPLVTWGYHFHYSRWLALLDRLEAERAPVINPVPLLRWNSDKAYLAELGAAGVATVPTISVEALDEAALDSARDALGTDELVIKPPVSASADGTYRLAIGDPLPDKSRGRQMLIQPFLPGIASDGEYSLMLFDGMFSHAIVKRPKPGDFRVQPHLGGSETACAAPDGGIELARAALAAAPAPATYARIDMVADQRGVLRIMELELIEPALWLDHAPDGGQMFAAAVGSAARGLRE